MAQILWDASSLLKRYYLEAGSATGDALFADVSVRQASTVLGYAETYSILLRKRNAGVLAPINFDVAVTALEDEVLFSPAFDLIELDSAAILAGIPLMRRHNINASDAAILAAFLHYSRAQPLGGQICVMTASDQRLLWAAAAEGLGMMPEVMAPADVPARLAAPSPLP